MADRMVAIKSMVDNLVSVRKPEYGINRRWQTRGQVLMLPYEQVEQLLWDGGFRNLIDSGILYIEDLQTKKDLGLESADATKPENIIALNEQQLKAYLTELPLETFKRQVSRLPKLQVDNLISYAVEKGYTDSAKSAFLKDLTGQDILKMVSVKMEMEELDRREAYRQKRMAEYD